MTRRAVAVLVWIPLLLLGVALAFIVLPRVHDQDLDRVAAHDYDVTSNTAFPRRLSAAPAIASARSDSIMWAGHVDNFGAADAPPLHAVGYVRPPEYGYDLASNSARSLVWQPSPPPTDDRSGRVRSTRIHAHGLSIGAFGNAAEGAPNIAKPSAFTRTESLSRRAASRQVQEMAESMREGGWDGPPIKTVEIDGQMHVVDGHHRLAAAREAGIDVPYEVVDPNTVIGPGRWSSVDDIRRDSYSVGPDRLRR